MVPSLIALETSLLMEICLDSARETVFSCFVTLAFNLSLLTPAVVEVIPIKAEIPAIGAPTIAPIPVKKDAKLAVVNRAVNAPVVAANALIIVFARLYFLLIFR